MPTVIDSFIAEFTIDPKEFSKGAGTIRLDLKRAREDAEKTSKSFEAFGKNGASFIGKLRNEAVGLFLAFQGASSVTGFVTDLIKGDAATARMAGNIGMSTSRLSAWQLAIRGVGGDAKDAVAALAAIANAHQSFLLTGTTGHDADFKGLGVTLKDLESPERTLLKFADAAERLSKPEFYARMKRLGIPDSVINQLERGRVATEELVTAKEKEGAATDADAAAAERLQQKLSDLQSILTGAVRPAIYGAVEGLEAFDKEVGLANIAVPVMTAVLAALAIGVVAATWEFLLLGAAIAAAFKIFKEYGDYVKQTQEEGRKRRGVQRTDLDQATGSVTTGGVHSADGRPIDAETMGYIRSGARMGGGGGAAPALAPGVAGRKAYVSNYLKSAGLSNEQVDGIVAGMLAENSTLDPNIRGGYKRRAVGVGQWLGSRRKKLFAKYGENPNLQQQMEFLVSELRGGDSGGASVLAQSNSSAAMVAYLRDFMRPGDGLASDLRRGYAALGRRGPAGGGSGGGSVTNIGTITVNVANGDAKTIAKELPAAIERRKVTTQANRGLQ